MNVKKLRFLNFPLGDKKMIERMPAMLEIIKEIGADCLSLKRQGSLTEYAKGQLDLIRIISNELELSQL